LTKSQSKWTNNTLRLKIRLLSCPLGKMVECTQIKIDRFSPSQQTAHSQANNTIKEDDNQMIIQTSLERS